MRAIFPPPPAAGQHHPTLFTALALLLALSAPLSLSGQSAPPSVLMQSAGSEAGALVGDSVVPHLPALMTAPTSELRPVVERYTLDRAALGRRHAVSYSPARRERFRSFYRGWAEALDRVDFEALGMEGRVDHLLLANEIRYQLELLEREEKLWAEMAPLLPFARELMGLEEDRRAFLPVDPEGAAAILAALPGKIREAREAVRGRTSVSRVVALRAEGVVRELQRTVRRWYEHYTGFDPLFSWWVADPHRRADEALESYARFLREEVVGHRPGEEEPIVGDPIGASGMAAGLAYEMIPYTPEELIAVGWRELAWCEEELRRAAREMGLGEDTRAALERVKTLHVAPGRQPELVRELAVEAVEFLEERGLVTIPPLAKEIWRLEMLSPEAQRTSPFFLGGEVIRVSFPTDAMAHQDKLMSLRGNNQHFSRATVQHELIPGHHLQRFMYARHQPHRTAFNTPFWIEGNALYWEMLLWDLDFPRSPEDRVGMLFWRMHRAARIIFSLSFHLGIMTPEEAVDFLVERVGHERANATAEVRRSFFGSYSPLYQVAYMMGGLQLMALRREVVDTGVMTDREFHDAILEGGPMPIEMVRARLQGRFLPRDFRSEWRFAGDPR